MDGSAPFVPTISTKSTGRSSSFTDGSGIYKNAWRVTILDKVVHIEGEVVHIEGES